MTRREHLDWAIARAIQEMDYYNEPSKGLISMASDLRKHPETNSQALISLCMAQIMINPRISRQQVIDFLKGFN
jgi:hypothetical protein